jgi:membrane protein implicated in regulation of membrane protease activity
LAVSRVVLWLIVGAIVLITALMLTHIPKTRHPMTAVVGAMLFAGLLAIAPDAAVLAGHFAVIALVLVIVMIAVRSLVTPRSSDRILASREARRRAEASTHSLNPPAAEKRSSVTHTQALPSPSPTEVTP